MTTALSTDPAEAQIFKIAAGWLADLEQKFEKLGRRAARIGVPAPTFTVLDTVEEPEMVPALSYQVDGAMEPTGRTRTFYLVTVTGEAPSYNGWKMAAVIDRDLDEAPDGPHVVHVLDGVTADDAWRFAPDFCDYCAAHNRTHPQGRKTLVVVAHEDGTRKVVGTTCLRDFLGHQAPTTIASWIEMLSTLTDLLGGYADDDTDRDVGHRTEWRIVPAIYLAWVAATIRTDGWVPRSAVRFGGGVATADAAIKALDDYNKQRRLGLGFRDWRKEDIEPPTDQDDELAAAALAWAAEIEVGYDTNDYLANVAAVAAKSGWRSRDLGIGASIIAAYKRATEQELKRKARKASLAGSKHVGQVKDRVTFTGTVIFDRSFEGAYGTTLLLKILTDDGNVLTWWASNGGPTITETDADGRTVYRSLTQGDRIVGKATIKAHEEYEGVAQTVITRAKVMLAPPTLLDNPEDGR